MSMTGSAAIHQTRRSWCVAPGRPIGTPDGSQEATMLRHARALIAGLFVIVVYGVQSPAHLLADINLEVQSVAPVFPDLIPLPIAFGPEGIAGNGKTFYVGSLGPATLGQILAGDLQTGELFQL